MFSISATKPPDRDTTRKRPDLSAQRTRVTSGATELTPVDIDAAYDACEQITRAQAHSFYRAIEPQSAYRRRALCAIYAFARRVRDVADGTLPPADKLHLLAEARAGIPRGDGPRPVDPVLMALRDVNRRFRLPLGSLDDLIDGAESDVYGVTNDTFDDGVRYWRQVAGSIGRLSVTVLGSRDPVAAAQLADDLGVAIELTKRLRELVEGSENGRTYLPRDTIRDLARRNRTWYDRGLPLLALLDARGAACVVTMTGIHRRELDRLERSADEAWASGSSLAGARVAR
jgi:phytoene synthase